MGDKKGLIEAIEKIQPQKSTKDGKYYYTREELVAIVDEIKNAGYWGQVDKNSENRGIYLDNNWIDANWNRAFGTNFYNFQGDQDMLDAAMVYNEIADDRSSWKYSASEGHKEGLSMEFEKILKDTKGWYDVNFLRSLRKVADEGVRATKVKQYMNTYPPSPLNENPVIGSSPELLSANDAAGKIINSYFKSYKNIREESAIHHIFCCYDKDSKDSDGNWAWKKDDLGQDSPMFAYYKSLSGKERSYFEQGMEQIQKLAETNKYITVGEVLESNKTIQGIVSSEKSRRKRREVNKDGGSLVFQDVYQNVNSEKDNIIEGWPSSNAVKQLQVLANKMLNNENIKIYGEKDNVTLKWKEGELLDTDGIYDEKTHFVLSAMGLNDDLLANIQDTKGFGKTELDRMKNSELKELMQGIQKKYSASKGSNLVPKGVQESSARTNSVAFNIKATNHKDKFANKLA